MDINKIKDSDYLDILFDEKNKKYGSYELRKKYAKRALLGGLLSILFVGGAFALTLIPGSANKKETEVVTTNVDIKNIPAPKPKPEPKKEEPPKEEPKPKKEAAPAQQKGPADPTAKPKYKETQKATVLEVKANDQVKAENTIKDLKKEAENGIADLKGDKDGFTRGMDKSESGKGTTGDNVGGIGQGGIGTDNKAAAGPTWTVAKQADPGYDIHAWLARNITYTPEAQREEITGKIVVRIVVGTDGSVSDVTVIGKKLGYGLDDAAIKVIKNKLPKFKAPGYDAAGNPVKSYYRIPVTFNLAN